MANSEMWRIALAQTNPSVGDLSGNTAQIRGALERAGNAGAALGAGAQAIVRDLDEVWAMAEKVSGGPVDPLDPRFIGEE